MNTFWRVGLSAYFALSADLLRADDVIHAQGQPITVWEKGKTSGDPIQALKQLVGLPNGVVGESKQSLKDRLLASHARIVSEVKTKLSLAGK